MNWASSSSPAAADCQPGPRLRSNNLRFSVSPDGLLAMMDASPEGIRWSGTCDEIWRNASCGGGNRGRRVNAWPRGGQERHGRRGDERRQGRTAQAAAAARRRQRAADRRRDGAPLGRLSRRPRGRRLLIAAGAKVDAPTAKRSRRSDGLAVRQRGDDRTASRGRADAKQRLSNGETMVMLAARNGNSLAIRMLVAAGAESKRRRTCAHDRADVGRRAASPEA